MDVSAAPAESAVFDTGLILGSSPVISPADRVRSFSSPAEILAAGFGSDSPEYMAALGYFGVSPSPASVLIGRMDTGETLTRALTEVLKVTRAFYGIYACQVTDKELLDLAKDLDSYGRFILFYACEGTLTEVTGAGGLFRKMKDLNAKRVLGTWLDSTASGGAVMGLAMGLVRAHTNDAFALCYKSLSNVPPMKLTQSEVDTVKDLNANVYILRGANRAMLENGTLASGARYDEVLYMDSIASDLQEACLSVIAGSGSRLPQNDTATTAFFNAISSVLDRYTQRGILGPAVWRGAPVGNLSTGDTVENGYALFADPYDSQSAADRAAHKAMPIHIILCFTGSVEALLLNVHVQQ